jgi:two-component system cell cycle sensor histidine kinase/response regulator CckA
MADQKKTKAQLIEELQQLRARLSDEELTANGPYRAVFESTTEGILIADISTHCFVDANPTLCRMLEYTREQLMGKSVKDIHPPEALDRVLDDFADTVQGGKAETRDVPCLKSDGTIFYADIRVGKVDMDGRPCVAGFFSDVTERRHACHLANLQRDLAIDLNSATNLNAALRQCLDTAIVASGMDSGGIYLVDHATGSLELQYHSGLSHRFVSMSTHYDAEAPNTRFVMSGKPTYMTHSELLKLLKGSQGREHLRALAVVPVVHAGKVIACLNIASHTTDDISPDARHTLEGIAAAIGSTVSRLRAEQALASTEARYHEVFGTIQEGIGIVDDNETILLANPAYARIFDEESVDAIIGRSLFEFLPDDQREIVLKQTEQRREGEFSKYELDIVTKKGNRKTLFVSVTPRFSSEGRYTGAVGAVLDITERKRTEEGLRESEAFNRAVIDNSPIGISIRDAKARLLSVNKAWMKIWGVSQRDVDQYIEESATEFIGAANREQLGPWLPQVESIYLRGGTLHIPELYYAIDPPARPRWVSFTYYSLMNDRGEVDRVVILTEDITERKLAEEALRESEGRFRELTDLLPQTVYELDASGRFTFSNEFGFASTGYTQAHIEAGLNALDLVAPNERERCAASMQQVLAGVRRGADEYTMRRKDGSEFPAIIYSAPILCDGRVVGIRGMVADISERIKAEKALRESEERLKDITFSMADWVWEVNEKGVYTYTSHHVSDILGRSAEEILGKTPFDFMPADEAQRVAEIFSEIVAHKAPIEDLENWNVRKNGDRICLLTSGVPILDEEGNLKGYRGVDKDITERKRVEEELRRLSARHETLLASVPDIIMEVDSNKVYTWANRPGYDFFGDDVIGKEAADYFEGKQETYSAVQPVFAGDEDIIYVESWQRRRDGEKRLLAWWCKVRKDAEGRVIGALSTARDITERKQAEEVLRATEEKYRTLVNNVPIAVYRSTPSGKVLSANPALIRILGYDSEEDYCSRPAWNSYVDPHRRKEFIDELRKHGSVTDFESQMIRKDGTVIWVSANATVHKNENGEIEYIDGTEEDITELKHAREALAESEERYRQIVEASPFGMHMYELEPNGRLVFEGANPAADWILRIDHSRLKGKTIEEAFPALVETEVPEQYRSIARHGERWRSENITYEDGRIKGAFEVVAFQRSPMKMAAVFKDITDRKRAEESSRIAEEQYRLLFEGAGEGILVAQDGNVVLSNLSLASMLGYSQDELCQKPLAELIYPEDREIVMDRYQRRISGEDVPTGYDFRVLTKAGEVKTMRINASAIAWGGRSATLNFIIDVTASRKAEEDIRKFKTISDNATCGTHIISPDATFLYVNQAFAAMHGYSPDELVGRHVSLCHTEEQMTLVSAGMQEVLRSGGFTSREIWHLHRDGTEFPTLMTGVVIKDADGNSQLLAATTVDITELKRLQEHADRGHRLEAAGRIAGQVAHDFNNLLGPLVAYPGIIREELGEGHPVNAYLEPIETAAQQMADINQQLLTLGRRGHYTLEPLNLNEIIRQTLKRIQSDHSRLKVVDDLAASLMNISGGVAQLSRVITNLVTNAADAMQCDGTLTVRSENWYADKAQGKYGQIAQGEYVKVTIADTGSGIPEDVMPHVFEPFFTTKKADRKRGSGLGLSVVHAVVEDHHGYVDIDSVVGEGTSIYLYFPITREEVFKDDASSFQGGNESVLVVDDDATQREVTLRLLQKLGYRAETVDCGEVALQRLRSKSFDLLILDMIMPGGFDGADTYKRAKELHPEQRAIIVSGYAESGRVSEAQRIGAGDFVRKPLTLKSLSAAVRRELDRKLVTETIC